MKTIIKKKKEMIINLLEKYHIGYDIAFALRDEILSKLSKLEADEKDNLKEKLKIAFNAGRLYGIDHHRHPYFDDWYNEYLKSKKWKYW